MGGGGERGGAKRGGGSVASVCVLPLCCQVSSKREDGGAKLNASRSGAGGSSMAAGSGRDAPESTHRESKHRDTHTSRASLSGSEVQAH